MSTSPDPGAAFRDTPTETTETQTGLGQLVSAEKLPRHIAIIMDGNGRWARQRGLPRIEGHRRGAGVVRRVTEECARLGIEQLTLFCLSSENWKRPAEEIAFLMELLKRYMVGERKLIMEQNIRVSVIGRRDGIFENALREMDQTVAMSAQNSGMRLCLAINYGSRAELVDACRSIAEKVQRGDLRPDQINEATLTEHLYTADMPEPDLLIRTAREMRVSNFLLWQISYAEIWVTDLFWPEFDVNLLHTAIRDFAARDRRFGGIGGCACPAR
jgi:undecaprenyl diphosphate synthase